MEKGAIVMIMKYINMDFSEHEAKLGNKIEADEDYKDARKTFKESLSLLDRELNIKIEDHAGYVETLAKDIAYNEGFKEGVRFILGCISTGKEVFQHE